MRSILLSLLSASLLGGAALAREVGSRPAAALDFANVKIYAARVGASNLEFEMLDFQVNAQISKDEAESTAVARTSSPNRTW